jgi:hypothetical protein
MLAYRSIVLRGLSATTLLFLAAQCSSTSKPASPGSVTSPVSTPISASSDRAVQDQSDIQFYCDSAPHGQKGIEFTLLSRVDKKIEFGFPDGTDTLELTKNVAGTALFIYDPASGKVTLKTSNGKATRGPKEVPKGGSFNPVKLIGPITERPATKTADGRLRTLVTGRNHGLEFSFTVVRGP